MKNTVTLSPAFAGGFSPSACGLLLLSVDFCQNFTVTETFPVPVFQPGPSSMSRTASLSAASPRLFLKVMFSALPQVPTWNSTMTFPLIFFPSGSCGRMMFFFRYERYAFFPISGSGVFGAMFPAILSFWADPDPIAIISSESVSSGIIFMKNSFFPLADSVNVSGLKPM